MIFAVLNSPLYPCPRTHFLHVRKLASGFVQRGYHFRIINKIDEIFDLEASDILYVSSHFCCDITHRPFSKPLQRKLIPFLRKTKAKLILWNFHILPSWSELNNLDKSIVHLGEDLYDHAVDENPVLSNFRKEFDVLAIKYGSPMHPSYPCNVSVEKDLDFNFVGHPYKEHLTRHCNENYSSLIRKTPPSISEALRVNSFRNANINLVFHANANVQKGIVVERFSEALSFGGIIFHDHPRIAHEYKNVDSIMFVQTTDDIDKKYKKVMAMSEVERIQLRQNSWEVWKENKLSYFDQAERILKAFKI